MKEEEEEEELAIEEWRPPGVKLARVPHIDYAWPRNVDADTAYPICCLTCARQVAHGRHITCDYVLRGGMVREGCIACVEEGVVCQTIPPQFRGRLLHLTSLYNNRNILPTTLAQAARTWNKFAPAGVSSGVSSGLSSRQPGLSSCQPEQTKPAQTEPAQTKSAQTKPAQTKPAQTETAQPGLSSRQPENPEPGRLSHTRLPVSSLLSHPTGQSFHPPEQSAQSSHLPGQSAQSSRQPEQSGRSGTSSHKRSSYPSSRQPEQSEPAQSQSGRLTHNRPSQLGLSHNRLPQQITDEEEEEEEEEGQTLQSRFSGVDQRQRELEAKRQSFIDRARRSIRRLKSLSLSEYGDQIGGEIDMLEREIAQVERQQNELFADSPLIGRRAESAPQIRSAQLAHRYGRSLEAAKEAIELIRSSAPQVQSTPQCAALARELERSLEIANQTAELLHSSGPEVESSPQGAAFARQFERSLEAAEQTARLIRSYMPRTGSLSRNGSSSVSRIGSSSTAAQRAIPAQTAQPAQPTQPAQLAQPAQPDLGARRSTRLRQQQPFEAISQRVEPAQRVGTSKRTYPDRSRRRSR